MSSSAPRPDRRQQRPTRRAGRTSWAVLGGVLAAAATVLVTAGPASAKVPQGWSLPDDVAPWQYLLVLFAIPVGLALLIALLVYVPALVRGERVAPGEAAVEDQWFGGPRQGTAELAGPDDENSRAGGASARW